MDKLILGLNSLLIVIYAMIVTGETGVYAEWKNKLDYKALYYLNHPTEIAESAQKSNLILLSVLMIIISAIGIYAFYRFFHQKYSKPKNSILAGIVFLGIGSPLLLLGIRGGLQAIPVNQAESYFSEHLIVNLVAVNPGYKLYESYLQSLC